VNRLPPRFPVRRTALLLALALAGACGVPPADGPAPATTSTGTAEAEAGPGDTIAYYTCPMHTSIRAAEPGSCPICGMTLTPVTQAELQSGAVRVDADRRAKFGIELVAAALRPMASVLRVPAVVTWDPDRVQDVSVRASGWVESLPGGAPGEEVRAGQVLFTLYSPELVASQDDLFQASAQVGTGVPGAEARRDAARTRLQRLGLTTAQVARIEAVGHTVEQVPFLSPRSGFVIARTAVEGAMVTSGQTLFRIGDLREVWLEGAVPEGRLAALTRGQEVTVRLPGEDPSRPGSVAQILPQVDPATRTARIRVRLDNADGALRPDQWATVEIALGGGERLAVPESAVLYTGPRRLVFVEGQGDLLEPRQVHIGMKADGYVEIVDGLAAGERVVRAGTFLVAADSRLKGGGGTP